MHDALLDQLKQAGSSDSEHRRCFDGAFHATRQNE
jgi:hypothetical protein